MREFATDANFSISQNNAKIISCNPNYFIGLNCTTHTMKQKNVILMSSPIVSEVANLHKKRLKIPQIDKKGGICRTPWHFQCVTEKQWLCGVR